MARIKKTSIVNELKKRLEADNKDLRPLQVEDYCFDKQIAFINDPARFKTAVCSRRCLAKGTLVQTTLGPKPIETVTTEDWVYDEYGLPIKVKAVYDNGIKEIADLQDVETRLVLVSCTGDHIFLDKTNRQIAAEYLKYKPQKLSGHRATIKWGSNIRQERTYDIHVDSATNLYMLANGLITHNSGKTVACAVDLLTTAHALKGDVAYITLNRRSAKRIIWKDLVMLNKTYNLGGKVDKQELSITMPNSSTIYVSGAKDEAEIERFRGMALRKVYIDEAQSFRGYIQELIEDVIEPALTDYYGTLALIGTPGPLPSGFFYDMSHNKGWAHHHWTMQENPHIQLKSGKDPLDIIKELAERRGLTLNSPSILREYFGQWVRDIDSLVYTFDPEKNLYTELPDDIIYVFGIDLGFNDSDAIAVLGYSSSERKVYLVEEYVKAGTDISSLVAKIKELQGKYQPVKMVLDAGALGKKIQEEIRLRHGVHTEAAEKSRKFEYIALLNDDLRTGKFRAKPGSRFEEDSYLVEWDFSVPDRPQISSNYHTDIGDAVLYAWRECRHFYEKDVEPPPPTPDQSMEAYWEREGEAVERAKAGEDDYTDVNSWEDLYISEDDVF